MEVVFRRPYDAGAVETELIYDDFLLRLDGPIVEVMSRDIKGVLRLHVNFAQASITPKKNDRLEVQIDDGGALDRPLLQPTINGIWKVWKTELPGTEEATLIDFFSEAERRRVAPRSRA
ncbi:MAG TPA: hypothetical protein VGH14_02815 [Solirubrobacterales bacterium]|jgi:hypothetical protein